MDHNDTVTDQIATSQFQNGADARTAKTMAAKALIAQLCETWPRCFFMYQKKRRPLKLGIHRDVLAAQPDIDVRELSIAMRIYTRNYGYLKACREGADRVGLDGEPAGTVTASEAGRHRHDQAQVQSPAPAIQQYAGNHGWHRHGRFRHPARQRIFRIYCGLEFARVI
jgi:sRNA-binding protein